MSDRETLAQGIADAIAHVVVGSGYYAQSIGRDAGREAAEEILARFVVVDREAPLPDDMIERAAAAIYERLNDEPWSGVGSDYGDFIRREARAALRAALGVTA